MQNSSSNQKNNNFNNWLPEAKTKKTLLMENNKSSLELMLDNFKCQCMKNGERKNILRSSKMTKSKNKIIPCDSFGHK